VSEPLCTEVVEAELLSEVLVVALCTAVVEAELITDVVEG
jgi:hypothetical protein